MSTKTGPIGQALMSSISELTLLPQTKLIEFIYLLGGKALRKMIEENIESLDILEYISGDPTFTISH